MTAFKVIDKVHMELSNYCNASCPMCARFFKNSPLLRPGLELSQISIDQFIKFFPKNYIRKMKEFLFCGTHGDPGMAKDLYEICQYIRDNSNASVRIHSNGGMRSEEFWFKLGELFSKNVRWELVFSIDGLEDTNHLYRRGVDWTKLMKNCSAFIKGGGRANWEFLVFKHNEHQVEEATALAKQMNFLAFIPKNALGVSSGDHLEKLPAIDANGKLTHWIEAPDNPEFRNLKNPVGEKERTLKGYEFPIQFYKHFKDNHASIQNNVNVIKDEIYTRMKGQDFSAFDKATVKCKAVERNELFITSDGTLLPCCYVGTQFTSEYNRPPDFQLKHELEKWGVDKFNLNKYTIEEVLKTTAFDRVFADSWKKGSCAEGKMIICADVCGENSQVDRIYNKKNLWQKIKLFILRT